MKQLMNTDSLTDIVSNAVGILIILAVLNLIQTKNTTYELEIPLQHVTNLQPVFFIAKDEKLLRVDNALVFAQAASASANGSAKQGRYFDLDSQGMYASLNPKHGLILHASSTSEWDDTQAIKTADTQINTELNALDPETQFAYFFVYDQRGDKGSNGFESFRLARDYLKARNVKSGWRPVNDNVPITICKSFYKHYCAYMPTYLPNAK